MLNKILTDSEVVLVPSDHMKDLVSSINQKSTVRKSFSVPEMEANASGISTTEDASRVVESIDNNFIFYPATITKTKNHDVLIRSFARLTTHLPQLKLIFSGTNWNTSLGQQLRELITELGINDKVIHLGFISTALKCHLFIKARCIAVPSQAESFNLAIWEAFHYGCPVVCSDDPEILEQVGNNCALISRAGDSIDLADKLYDVIINSNTRQRLIEGGKSRYFQYSDKSLLSGWEMIITDIATADGSLKANG